MRVIDQNLSDHWPTSLKLFNILSPSIKKYLVVSDVSAADNLIPLAARYATRKACNLDGIGGCHWEHKVFATDTNPVDISPKGILTFNYSGLYRIDVTLSNGSGDCFTNVIVKKNSKSVSERWPNWINSSFLTENI